MTTNKIADPPRVSVIKGVALAAAVFVASRIGLLLATQSPPASPFWPATGIAVVGLLALGTAAWPWVAAGIFATNLASHYGLFGSIGATAASTIGALVGAMLLPVLSRRTESLGSLSDATTTLLASAVCALTAAIGAPAALVLAGAWHGPVGFTTVRTWFVGDMLGALLIVPLWLDAKQRRLEPIALPSLVRFGLVLLLTAATLFLLFQREGGAPFAFALFPLIVVAVALVGPLSAHVLVLSLAVPVTWATMHGRGLHRHISVTDGLMYAQAIMGTLGLTAQVVASVKRAGPLRTPALVMFACWLLFGLGYASYIRGQDELEQRRFSDVVSDVESSVGARMTAYEEVLRATAARLSTAREDVDAKTFRAWVETLRVPERHPGVLGIGLATPVPESDAAAFLARMKLLGVDAEAAHDVPGGPFDWKDVPRDGTRYLVSFIEPLSTNAPAVGVDLGSEPTRRRAADLARDTGLPATTAPLHLVQDGKKRVGQLFCVPFYTGIPVGLEARRKSLVGWVYAAIVGEELFGRVLEQQHQDLAVSVHDGATLVYASPSFVVGKVDVEHPLVFGQRTFTLRWQRGPMLVRAVDVTGVWIGVFGAVVPLLLAGLMGSVQSTGLRAREIARQKTSILEQQGEMLEQATQAAESASRSKTAFLANTSHELRTPIAGILGMARLLLDSRLDREQRDHVRAIHRSGEALLALVNDILDIAKVESGKLELESIPFDVRQLIEHLSKGARVQAEEKGLSFIVRVEGDVAPAYLGDPVRIRQVLQNLVSNALKFTRKGEVEVSLHAQGDELRFAVRDTGIGIPKEVRARLFQSFSQADPTTTRRFGGTGLGLAISRELVERMGGVIGFESEPGRGSTFHFQLRLSEATDAPEEESLDRIPVAREACDILLVEDNDVTAMVGARVLERMGHRVTVVGNGREAIDALRLRFFDLVLMDCQMPVMDGFEATARIRAGEAGARQRDIPVVALTASAMKGDRDASLASGMNDHLSKPLRAELLGEVIARHARNTRRSRPMSLDTKVIAALEEVGGAEMLASLVEMFREQVPEALATMRVALLAGEGEKLERAAHTLKSGAASLGAMSIAAMAHGLEHGTLETAAAHLDELEAEHAVVMRLLEDVVRKSSEKQHP